MSNFDSLPGRAGGLPFLFNRNTLIQDTSFTGDREVADLIASIEQVAPVDRRLVDYLKPSGDADNDGISNIDEFFQVCSDLAAAQDPPLTIGPGGDFETPLAFWGSAGRAGKDQIIGLYLDAAVLNPAEDSVPDVLAGMDSATQEDAETILTDAGYTVGTITYVHSDTVAAGMVLGSDPPAGSPLALGSPVDLIVSLGPAPLEPEPPIFSIPAAGLMALLALAVALGATATSTLRRK
jgi:hypothetical protein